MLYQTRYPSPLGEITLTCDGLHLTGLWFEGQKYAADLPKDPGAAIRAADLPVFARAKEWLDLYFHGCKPSFSVPLAPQGSPFRRMVWDILLQIPWGQTMSYKEIAEKIATQKGIASMSAQAVGGAVGHNPISILIPCHRVIGSDGSLTGYAGGLDRKRFLLDLESHMHDGTAVLSH